MPDLQVLNSDFFVSGIINLTNHLTICRSFSGPATHSQVLPAMADILKGTGIFKIDTILIRVKRSRDNPASGIIVVMKNPKGYFQIVTFNYPCNGYRFSYRSGRRKLNRFS